MKTTALHPDPLASWEEKKSNDYALSYAQLIAQEWFDGGMITDDCQYGTRRDYIINNRLIVRGEQDMDLIKKHMARQEGDENYLNLSYDPVNIAGKFCRVVSNGINEENYRLDIRANDRLSVMHKKSRIERYRNDMRSLPLLKQVKKGLGLDLIPKGFIPEDEEELQLYAEIKDRPKVEIAEEIIIDYIDKTNNKPVLENQKNKDLVEIGISAERIYTDPINGVQYSYTDPEYLVHSYVNRNDFSDAYYFGYIDTITIDDIQREGNYNEKTLRDIAKGWATFNKKKIDYFDYSTCDFSDLLGHKIQVLRYAFKTSKTKVYKVKKKEGQTIKISSRDENYNPPERKDYGRVDDTKDTWMEGTYIINSEYVYGHKECENLVRDERNKPLSPFNVKATNIYKNKLHSFLDDIKVPERELQYIHLKMQHLTAELKPDLTIINEDALADLTGTGDKATMWQETLNLLNVKGVIIEKTIDMGEMGVQRAQAARPAASQQGSGLSVLLNQWNRYYELIRDTTGVNPARDGSLPHDALLGVNQMAQLASNTATKHIVDASVQFNKTHAETLSSRVHNIFKSKQPGAKSIQEMYRKAVGKQNIDALEAMADRHLHDFGFTVNMVPSQQEMKAFNEDLSLFLQSAGADIETIAVKNEAQQIAKTNIKLANQYLFYMGRKINKRRMEERAKEAQFKAQQDQKSTVVATQAKTQASAVEAEIDVKKEAQLVQLEIFKEQQLQLVRLPEEERKFKQDVFLKRLEELSQFNKAEYMEDRKDQRTKIQASQQSRMIPERKSDNPQAINFEQEDPFAGIFAA